MANIGRLEKRVAALQQEQAGLGATLADLQREHSEKRAALAGLWATAERSPGEEAALAADRAEREHDNLGRQVARKQAALQACEADLAGAQAALDAAQRGEVVAELRGLIDQVEQVAQRVDANIGDHEAWAELVRLTKEGNSLYWARLRGNGDDGFQAIFQDSPDKLRGRLFGVHAERCDRAMAGRPVDMHPATMAELLHLDHARGRVRSLMP